MTDELRDMLAETIKEAEGKTDSVVDTAAKLEPEVKEPEVKDPVEKKEPEAEVPEKKEPPVEEGDDKTDKESPAEPLLAQDKAPAGWTPKVREMWATVPKEVRDEIIRREDASAQGVRKLQAEVEPMRGFVQQLDPFIKEAVQSGANPGQYIGQVMASEKALRNPDENARFEALLAIADNYRIPLREIINASVGREVIAARPAAAQQVPEEVQRELQAQREWRAQQEQQSLINEIETFKKGAEFFEDARPVMANLITANPNMTLQEAYDQAIWASPAIREVLLARQSKKTDPIADKQKEALKASGGNEEIHVRTRAKGEESTLEDDLRESIVAMSGRT